MEYAVKGMNGVMPIIQRISDSPYKWKVVPAPLNKIANVEKKLPANFISKDGFSLTSKAKAYFQPLVEGDSDPKRIMSYKAGKMHMVQKKLKPWA